MKLTDYSYKKLFNNPFKINTQTMEIKYFLINLGNEQNEQKPIEDNQQDNKQNVTKTETTLPVESVSYELKDITPKKKLWRK